MPAITNPKCNKNTTYNTDKTMQNLRLNLKTCFKTYNTLIKNSRRQLKINIHNIPIHSKFSSN